MKASACMRSQSLSCVQLFVTPWTVAHQALLSVGFSWKEYWSGSPFPPPGDHPDPGTEACLQHLLHWQANSLQLRHLGNSSIILKS